MSGEDQAAGLRRWAEQYGRAEEVEKPSAEAETLRRGGNAPLKLLVIGLPGPRHAQTALVRACLARWQSNGHRWVGDASQWKVVAMDADSPHLAVLASQQSRWALWVEDDGDGFRRAWRSLRLARELEGPRRLLVLHGGIPNHAGLLHNLRQAAAGWLDTELLLLPERPEEA